MKKLWQICQMIVPGSVLRLLWDDGMKKVLNRSLVLGLLISLCNYACYYLTAPIIVSHLSILGIDAGRAGLISGIIFVVMAVSRPFAGFLSDRTNLRNLLITGIGFYAVSFSGMVFSGSLAIILLLRILYGIGLCLISNAANTYALSGISKENMGRAVSYLGLVPAVCSAFFSGIGLKIADAHGTAAVFSAAAFVSLLTLVPVFLMKSDANHQPETTTERKKLSVAQFIDFSIIPYALLAAAFAVSIGVVNTFIVTTAKGNGIFEPGLFFTVAAIVMVFLKLSSGYLIDRKGLKIVAVPAFILSIIALLMIPNASSKFMLAICAILFAFAQGAGQPAMQTQCYRMVMPSRRGVAVSTFMLAISLGQATGNFAGGFLIENFGFHSAYYFCAALLFAALCAFLHKNAHSPRT